MANYRARSSLKIKNLRVQRCSSVAECLSDIHEGLVQTSVLRATKKKRCVRFKDSPYVNHVTKFSTSINLTLVKKLLAKAQELALEQLHKDTLRQNLSQENLKSARNNLVPCQECAVCTLGTLSEPRGPSSSSFHPSLCTARSKRC